MTFSSMADNYSAYPIHRYLENPKSNIEIIMKYNHFKKFRSMFRKSLKKGINNIFSNNSNFANPKIENRGYVYSDKVVTLSDVKNTEHLYSPLLSENLLNTKLSLLEEFTTSLKNKGMEVVYFELPTNKSRDYFSQDYLSSYDSFTEKLSKTNNFLKINTTLFTNSDFRNIDHMNDNGAVKATMKVVNYLNDMNVQTIN